MKNRGKALKQMMRTDGLVLEMAATFYQEFFVNKEYDWWYSVQPGDVVVDIGACVGMMSARALDGGASKVYMIEGNRELLKTAMYNVSEYLMNELDPIVYPINCIMGSCNEEGVYKTHVDKLGTQEIDRMSFQQFLEKYSINHIDFLKIDIEGNEYDILNTENLDFIKNNVKHIAVEIHTRANENSLTRFIHFRDTFLKYFWNSSNHKVRGIYDQKMVNEIMWDNEKLENVPDDKSYFMLYITRE